MREIKFRAWDKDNNKMYTPAYEAYRGNLFELLLECHSSSSSCSGDLLAHTMKGMEHESLWPDRFKLMQYTGLKDKKGVEIYEGDVIEYRAYMAWHRDAIKFTNGEFHGQLSGLKEEHQSRYSLGLIVSLGAEVIGNIHENPELLEALEEV